MFARRMKTASSAVLAMHKSAASMVCRTCAYEFANEVRWDVLRSDAVDHLRPSEVGLYHQIVQIKNDLGPLTAGRLKRRCQLRVPGNAPYDNGRYRAELVNPRRDLSYPHPTRVYAKPRGGRDRAHHTILVSGDGRIAGYVDEPLTALDRLIPQQRHQTEASPLPSRQQRRFSRRCRANPVIPAPSAIHDRRQRGHDGFSPKGAAVSGRERWFTGILMVRWLMMLRDPDAI